MLLFFWGPVMFNQSEIEDFCALIAYPPFTQLNDLRNNVCMSVPLWQILILGFFRAKFGCPDFIRIFCAGPYRPLYKKAKGKGFPYSLPIFGSKVDPDLQAVSPQVTISHPPGGRLPLLFAKPAVTFPTAEHHHPVAGTKLYCLVTEAHRCEQLAKGCYAAFGPSRI